MPRLFVDLDGVLADFDEGAARALGMPCGEFLELHGEAVMWKHLQATPEFYARLPWTGDGEALWTAVTGGNVWKGPAPMILSEVPDGVWAQPQKREWCALQLGLSVPVMLCAAVDKARYCVAGDVLIDDRERGRLDWETAGGKFVLHRSVDETLAQITNVAV